MENTNYKILNGNELIIQGALEAGFSLYTGYPGSPLAEYFNILYNRKNELKEKGIRVVIANSEANAAAMASGAKQAGRDCIVAMKSMGLHVASDALSVGNFASPARPIFDSEFDCDTYPAVVVVVGDDPWSMSTSTAADSRYLYKHLHMSFLEPSTPSELKDWISKAREISKKTGLYQGLLLTTFLAEGGGRVKVNEEKKVSKDLVTLDPQTFDLSKNVMVPPNSLLADIAMIKDRFPKVSEVLKELKLDKVFGNLDSKVGFISSGVIFETLKQVFHEANLLSHFSLFKIACSYPLVEELLLPYLRNLEYLIVVEEKRGFLETELSEFCQKHGLKIKILGKKFEDKEGFPAHGGLNYEILCTKIDEVLNLISYKSCDIYKKESKPYGGILPRRLPTFCPGCPHRETLSLLKDLRGWLKGQGIDLITHGDVGCYSLSFLPPFKEMHNLSAMGQGGALGAGVDIFTKNPSVVLMGDSTFFHSGLTDISNSMQLDHDITYILLDNDNTAMTGHQMSPASGVSVEGRSRPRQSMLNVVKSLGVQTAVEVNPSDRYFYQNLMRDFIKRPGVKVIVSNKECSLTFQAKKRKVERDEIKKDGHLKEKKYFQINPYSCEDCRVCVESTGCPGLTQIHDAYGTKVAIDPMICVSDSYCTKLKACPSFEEVIVHDFGDKSFKASKNMNLQDLANLLKDEPANKVNLTDISETTPWRMVVTGVGGSGITTVSKIISKAAVDMGGVSGLDFKFMDQKGLAQRNGNVSSHMSICHENYSLGAVTPIGGADLLISPDLLDGSNQLSFLKTDGVAIFDKSYQVPLSIMLDRNLDSEKIKNDLLNQNDSRIVFLPMKKWSEIILGKSVYVSSMILGAAFQLGKIPFSNDDLITSIKTSMKQDEVSKNIDAFYLGREMAFLGVEEFSRKYQSMEKNEASFHTDLCLKSLEDSFYFWQNKKYWTDKYKKACDDLVSAVPEIKAEYLVQYIHDQFIFDRGHNITEFISGVKALKTMYQGEDFKRAVRAYAKTFVIKDEVFISHQMISTLITNHDNKKYQGLGRSFSKKRINRPSFDILGRKVEFDISPKDWMLKSMRHFRILRSVLPSWHKKEKEINAKIRHALIYDINKLSNASEISSKIKDLENIKGYREVRYKSAQGVF